MQDNLWEMRNTLGMWNRIPLFERKESKRDTVLCLEERQDRITRRYSEIESSSSRIQEYVASSCIVKLGIYSLICGQTFTGKCGFVRDERQAGHCHMEGLRSLYR